MVTAYLGIFNRPKKTLKEFKLYTVYFRAEESFIKPLQLAGLVRLQSSCLSSSSSPCLSSGNYSLRLFQKKIKGFDCKTNGRAPRAGLLDSLGWLDWLAQTQGVS